MHSDIDEGCLAPDRISTRTPLMIRPAAVSAVTVTVPRPGSVSWGSSTTDSGAPCRQWRTWNFTWSDTANASTATRTVMRAVLCVLII